MSIDPYTPWREDIDALRSRHVGRDDVVDAIVSSAQTHAAGDKPLHLYLYGARGFGKSHLLALTKTELGAACDQGGCSLVTVGEDIPLAATADELIQRILRSATVTGLPSWAAPAEAVETDVQRAVVLFEGLDRQLSHLKPAERKALRRFIAEQDIWVVGTGVSLSDVFTKQAGAFYGAFSPYPLEPLDDEAAAALLDKLVTEEVVQQIEWPTRRAALVGLAGGSPRTLVSLAGACVQHPKAWASDHLHSVVRQFTAHYQMRFRDLSPTGQRVVEQITHAPGAMSPGAVAEAIGGDPKSVGVAMRRMLDEGVLTVRHEGRRALYTVAEPLFRFWYEYRSAPWEETRVGWLAHLIEAVLSPQEMARAWAGNPDAAMIEPLSRAIKGSAAGIMEAWQSLVGLASATKRLDHPVDWERLVERAVGLGLSATDFGVMALRACSFDAAPNDAAWYLAVARRSDILAPFAPALKFFVQVGEGSVAPKNALVNWLREAPTVDALGTDHMPMVHAALNEAVALVTSMRLSCRERRGRPWMTTATQRAQVARIPGLRATYLRQGKLRSHPPLIEAVDVLAAGNLGADAPSLLCAAQVRQEAALFAAALAQSHWLPACPLPTRPAPASFEAVAAHCLQDIGVSAETRGTSRHSYSTDNRAWTWSASWSEVSAATFQQIAAAASMTQGVPPQDRQVVAALARLGVDAPDRLEQLRLAAPQSHQALGAASALATQLRTTRHEDLHIELQRFAALSDGP